MQSLLLEYESAVGVSTDTNKVAKGLSFSWRDAPGLYVALPWEGTILAASMSFV